MTKKRTKWITYFAAFALIGVVLFFMKDQFTYFERVKEISLNGILMISFYFVLSQIINGMQLKWYMQSFDIELSLNEAFGLICMRSFGNYLPLSGGVVSNILYLKKKRNLPVSRYMSYIVGDTILKFFIFGLIGIVLIGGVYIFIQDVEVNWVVIGFLFAMFVASLIFILFPHSTTSSENKIIKWFAHMHHGWVVLKSNKVLMFKNAISHVIILILIALQFYVIFNEMSIDMSFGAVLILTIITNVIKVSSIFPGNLGLRETISGAVTNTFGFPFATGFAASIVGRAVSIVWIMILGVIYSFYFADRIERQ